MQLEKNWQQKTLEQLEKKVWTSTDAAGETRLIQTCYALRKKQLQDYTTEDLRVMIGQEIGLHYLIPMALEKLAENLFAEGNYFEGDLLKNVLNIDTHFWNNNLNFWSHLHALIADCREEIKTRKISTSRFDASTHHQF